MKTKFARYTVSSLIVTGIAVFAAPALVPAWGGSQQAAPPNPPASDTAAQTATPSPAPIPAAKTNPVLREALLAMRDNRIEDARRLLKSVDVKSLDVGDARRWRSLAPIVALRAGDRAWLKAITDDPQYFGNSISMVTTTTARLMQDGAFEQARTLISTIKEPENLDEVPRRRYLELRARLEQLDNHPAEERRYINQLIAFVSRWPTQSCQGCHARPSKFGDAITTLPLSDLWFADRYVKLMQKQGDAAVVLAQTQKALAKNPGDNSARLKLAYALRATGQEAKAIETLRMFPWAEFPDREKRTPLRLETFP